MVFGTTEGFAATFDLETLDGSNGFVLDGIDEYDISGRSVAGAGDVNGDGIDDLIVGAFRGDPNDVDGAGETMSSSARPRLSGPPRSRSARRRKRLPHRRERRRRFQRLRRGRRRRRQWRRDRRPHRRRPKRRWERPVLCWRELRRFRLGGWLRGEPGSLGARRVQWFSTLRSGELRLGAVTPSPAPET